MSGVEARERKEQLLVVSPVILKSRKGFSTASLRKQPIFHDNTTGFLTKSRLKNESTVRRNSILMMRHYPDLCSASDWLCRERNFLQPIGSTTQTWVVTRHQYGVSALVSQTSFSGETSGGVAKCRLFSQAIPQSERHAVYEIVKFRRHARFNLWFKKTGVWA